MINFIMEYWPIIIVAIAIICCAICAITNIFRTPSSALIENIRQWAIYACALAEKELGSGTGQLKLRATYDMFLKRFPNLFNIISFQMYQNIAESALAEFKKMLETNPSVKDIIIQEGEKKYGNLQDE